MTDGFPVIKFFAGITDKEEFKGRLLHKENENPVQIGHRRTEVT